MKSPQKTKVRRKESPQPPLPDTAFNKLWLSFHFQLHHTPPPTQTDKKIIEISGDLSSSSRHIN